MDDDNSRDTAGVWRMNRRLAAVEHYWLERIDADPLVLVRCFYGLVVFAWGVTVLPDLGRIYGNNGLAGGIEFGDFRIVSLFRWVSVDTFGLAAMVLMLAASAFVALNRNVRFTVPLTAFLFTSFADASVPWLIGAELVMILFGLWLAVFAVLTPTASQGHRRDTTGSRGQMPAWGLRLLQIQIVLAYVTTAYDKLLGNDWTDGSAVYHALASDTLRRFDPPAFLFDNAWLIRSMTWSTLAVEAALGFLLLWPRTRRWAVLLAIALHLGFQVFLTLGFFAPAMTIGILSFVSAADARRVLDWRPRFITARTAPAQ
ncbi:MAG: HTTM domain-containing protein [Acidimicrobiales bacterium]|nr:HTTM domain-containing protein [Acidimicrobiales bacterium]